MWCDFGCGVSPRCAAWFCREVCAQPASLQQVLPATDGTLSAALPRAGLRRSRLCDILDARMLHKLLSSHVLE